MSFIQKIFSTLFSSKILSSFLIVALLIPAVFLSIPPKKAHAQFIVHDIIATVFHAISASANVVTGAATPISAQNSTAQNLKIFLLDGIATALARGIVQAITAQTVNWINSGFNGNPAYITDPAQFFQNIGDQAVTSQLNGNLLNKLCTPFAPQIRLALVQQYLQQGQAQKCSLGAIANNYDAFTQNFENGGWDGWFTMTQNMQNNPYGSYLQAQDQLNLSVANQTKKYQDQLNWGQGFLSYEKCTGTESEQTEYGTSINANGGTCTTETPGSVINSQLEHTFGSTVDELNLTNSINQIVSALMTAGIKGIFGGIQEGLRGLSESGQSSNASLVSQLMTGSSASSADSSNTITSIYANVPSNLTSSIGAPTANGFLPSIDTNAVQTEINQQADTFQSQGTSNASAAANTAGASTGTGTTATSNTTGICTTEQYPASNAQFGPVQTQITETQAACTNDGGTWAPSPTGSTSGGTANTASPTSCIATPSDAPIITGVQGYDTKTLTYSPGATAGNYLVLYGNGFDANCDVVAVGGQNYTPTYTSTTQLNVLLNATMTGNQTVQVIIGTLSSNTQSVTIGL